MISNLWNNYVMSETISDNISESGDEDSEEEITIDAAVNSPNSIIVSKNLDIKKITPKLDDRDIVGIIFLGCDSSKNALSILEEGFKCNMENAILKWAKTESQWQSKILESLCIIQNFKVLHELGFNKEDVIKHYLPYQIYISHHIKCLRKCLYLLCEDLNSKDTLKLIELVKQDIEASGLHFKHFPQSGFLELYLLHWTTLNYDFCKLLSKLKMMELIDLQEKLGKVLNKSNNDATTSALNNTINEKLPVKKYFLNINNEIKQKVPSHKVLDNSQLASISSLQSDLSSITNIGEDSRNIDKAMRYNINCNNPGVCLIINQEAFYTERDQKYIHLLSSQEFQDRQGTECDKSKLEMTFRNFGFKVIVKDNLTHFDMIETVKKVVKEITVESSIFVCILSHGDRDVVYGTNSCKVAVSNIQRILTKSNKTHLSGKPKVLILQSCQGKEKQKITESEDDSDIEENINNKITTDGDFTTDGPVIVQDTADNLTFWATVPGFAAIRDRKRGTWFIQTLCDEMLRLGHNTHFQDICTCINNSVTAKKWDDVVMTPYFISTFRKKFYLPPIKSK